jgi:hypothetical protein
VVIRIPTGIDYTAQVTGSTLKVVQCEKCQANYAYVMTRTSTGHGRSILFLDNAGAQDRARQRAEDNLNYRLENACDPVPCPDCGWFQEEMLPKARKTLCQWMQTTGIALLIGAIAFAVVGYAGILMEKGRPAPGCAAPALGAGAVCALVGTVFLIAWLIRRIRLDPNALDLSWRIQRGHELALTKEQLQAVLAAAKPGEEPPAPPAPQSGE